MDAYLLVNAVSSEEVLVKSVNVLVVISWVVVLNSPVGVVTS